MPLMLRSKSEPTPPSSRSLTPAVRSTNPLNELMLLTIERTSMAFTERVPSRSRWVFDLPVTVTLSNITESFIWLFRRLTSCPYAGTNISRKSDSQSSLSFNSLIFNSSAEPYSRGLRFTMSEWQVSWLSPISPPSQQLQFFNSSIFVVSGFVWTYHNGDYSSGYCSGFAPDSLFLHG